MLPVRLAVDVLGIRIPLLFALMSSAALAFGVVIPIPTFCAKTTQPLLAGALATA
jgi:hypothetical protein